jgi:hypothetical protein
LRDHVIGIARLGKRDPAGSPARRGGCERRRREVTDTVLSALAKAWTATMITTALSLALLALPHLCDPSTYVRVVLSLDLFG